MTAIFFAGAESDTLMKALMENGVKRVLCSYWYIQAGRRRAAVRRWHESRSDVEFFLDSGAYTFWQKSLRPEEIVPDWRKYKKLYFAYVDQTWGHWCRIAELDLDRTFPGITDDIITEWREEMLERWPEAPITVVWHKNRGMKAWEEYCADPRIRHLAIGSSNAQSPGAIMRMCWQAHQAGKLVHGFGITRVNGPVLLTNYDSVDSSSWMSAQKYGVTFIFDGNRFQYLARSGYRAKGARNLFRRYFRAIGCDPALIEADNLKEVRKSSIIAWRLLSNRLEYLRKIQRRTLYQHELEIEDGELAGLLPDPRSKKRVDQTIETDGALAVPCDEEDLGIRDVGARRRDEGEV